MAGPRAVWAETGDIHGNVCADARLRDSDGKTPATMDLKSGQAGWDEGIRYGYDFHQLAVKLSDSVVKDKKDKVTRLAIHAHGVSGAAFVNGEHNDPLSIKNMSKFKASIALLQTSLAPGATVIFMSCMAGQGDRGDELLVELSKMLPGRKIVAFDTIGFAPGGKQQLRNGENCTEPGMRDTEAISPSARGTKEQQERDNRWMGWWNQMDKLPWASEYSPHAIVALNGNIIKQMAGRPQAVHKQNDAYTRTFDKPANQPKKPTKRHDPLPLSVELTEAEQIVYGVMDPNQAKMGDILIMQTGLHHAQIDQALAGLRRKMLVVFVSAGEKRGYVRFLNRYAG